MSAAGVTHHGDVGIIEPTESASHAGAIVITSITYYTYSSLVIC